MPTDLTTLGVEVKMNGADAVTAQLVKLRSEFAATKAEAAGLKNLGGGSGGGLGKTVSDLEGVATKSKSAASSLGIFSNGLAGAEKSALSFSRGLGLIGALGQVSGIFAIGLAIKSTISAIIEGDNAMAQLGVRVASLGGNIGTTVPQMVLMAKAGEQLTTFSQTEIEKAEALALQFDNIGKNVFPQAIAAILNMSTALGRDLESSAVLISKALSDPVGALTQLRRVGVIFTESQRDMIKVMVENGQGARAQAIEINALNKEFGGAAIAAKDTLGGALKDLKNSLADAARDTGPFGSALKGVIQDITGFIKGGSEASQVFGEGLVISMHVAEDGAKLLGASILAIDEAVKSLGVTVGSDGGVFKAIGDRLSFAYNTDIGIHGTSQVPEGVSGFIKQSVSGLSGQPQKNLSDQLTASGLTKDQQNRQIDLDIQTTKDALAKAQAQALQAAATLRTVEAQAAADAAKKPVVPTSAADAISKTSILTALGIPPEIAGAFGATNSGANTPTYDINAARRNLTQANANFAATRANVQSAARIPNGVPLDTGLDAVAASLHQQVNTPAKPAQPSSDKTEQDFLRQYQTALEQEANRAELEEKIAKSTGTQREDAERQLLDENAMEKLKEKQLDQNKDAIAAVKAIDAYEAHRIALAKDLVDQYKHQQEALVKAQSQANSAASGVLGTIGKSSPLLEGQIAYAKAQAQITALKEAGTISDAEGYQLQAQALDAITKKADGLDNESQSLRHNLEEAGSILASKFADAATSSAGIRKTVQGAIQDLEKLALRKLVQDPFTDAIKRITGPSSEQIKAGIDTKTVAGRLNSQIAAGNVKIDSHTVYINADSILGKDAQGNELTSLTNGTPSFNALPDGSANPLNSLPTDPSDALAGLNGGAFAGRTNSAIEAAMKPAVTSIFTSIGDSILKGLNGLDSAFGGSGSFGGDAISIGTTIASYLHSGGTHGIMHSVPSSVFSGAPRLHSGLNADEFPAILQRGESVTAKGGGSAPQLNFNVTNQTTGKVEKPTVTQGSDGSLNIGMLIRQAVTQDIASGGPIDQSMRKTYGVGRKPIGR